MFPTRPPMMVATVHSVLFSLFRFVASLYTKYGGSTMAKSPMKRMTSNSGPPGTPN